MKRTRLWLIAAILIICGTAAFASCTANDDNPSGQAVESRYVPVAPDYSDPTMWITADGDSDGTGADVFYVVSTWEDDWTTADGKVCHYADVWNPEHRAHMADLEMKKVAAYMSPGNRFFAPFYRHTTIQAFMTNSEDTVYQRTRLSAQQAARLRPGLRHCAQRFCRWEWTMCARPSTSSRHSVTSRARSSLQASARAVWLWWNC